MSDSTEDLRDKATKLVKKAAFKEGMRLNPSQESIAVNQLYESFKAMIDEGKAPRNFNHATIRMLLQTIKCIYP